MPRIVFSNRAKSTLAAGISDVAVSVSTQVGHGARFSSPGASEISKIVVIDAALNYEIMHCTSRTADALTIVRGQEGTAARAFAAGDLIAEVASKGAFDAFPQKSVDETITGNWAVSGNWASSGNWTFSKTVKTARGADLVSAATLTLGTDGNYFHVTGTVPIAAISALQAGTPIWLEFDAACPLTDGANLLLGGQNLVAIAGRVYGFISESAGVWRLATSPQTSSTEARNSDSTAYASTAWVRDHIGEPSSNLTVLKCGAVNLGQGATYYLRAAGTPAQLVEANAQVGIGMPTEFYGMKIYLSEAVPAGQTVTVTLRKNGIATSLTAVITGATVAGAVVSVGGSVLFGKDRSGTPDKVSVEAVTSAAFGVTNDITVALLARVPYSNNKPVSPFAFGSLAIATAYCSGGEFKTNVKASVSLNTALGEAQIPTPYTVVETFDQVQDVPSPFLDGLGASSVASGYSIPLAAGSLISWATASAVNTAHSEYTVLSDRQCGNEAGTWAPLIFSSIGQAQNTTYYMGGYGEATASLTEADVKVPMPAGKAWKLRAYAGAGAIPGADTCVITVRKNGVATGLTVTLNAANRYAADVSNTVTFADNDLISLSCVSSATAGANSYNAVLEVDSTT